MNKKIKPNFVYNFLTKVLLAIIFIALTKINFSIILGTEMRFSASAMFGPTISNFLGDVWGSVVIILSYLVGVIIGIYKVESFISWLTFLPIIIAGLYFSRVFKKDRKIILFPVLAVILFLSHPIGREVWYYSLFWFIPVLVAAFRPMLDKFLKKEIFKVYAFSLGATLVDHSVGSIIYLYSMQIPAKFWIAAIPFTLVERTMIAGGITLSYFAIKMFIYLWQKFENKRKLLLDGDKQLKPIENAIKSKREED
ncbi:MAG: hypothetical protein V1841_01970 [Patescibacteria group bacterium]